MEKLAAFISGYIDKVPSSTWGVIIGALVAFSGVLLTNRAHDLRLKKQFEHEREVKTRDREMALRKEVYLGAAEAVSAGLIAVGQFSNLEVKYEKLLEEYLSKSSSIAKTNIIANEKTLKAIGNFSGELLATFMRLTAKRTPLLHQSQNIATLRTLVDTFIKEQTRVLELMKQHNLDGSTDQRKWKLYQDNFDFETRRIDETSKKADELARSLALKQLGLMEECIEEGNRLSRLLAPVIASVREELDLPINEIGYSRMQEERIEKQTAALREFRKQVHSLLPPETGA